MKKVLEAVVQGCVQVFKKETVSLNLQLLSRPKYIEDMLAGNEAGDSPVADDGQLVDIAAAH